MNKPTPPTTHLVTTAILTPKTPVCLREGILFKLNSLLVNLTESFTSICRGKEGCGSLTLWTSEAEISGSLKVLAQETFSPPGQTGQGPRMRRRKPSV